MVAADAASLPFSTASAAAEFRNMQDMRSSHWMILKCWKEKQLTRRLAVHIMVVGNPTYPHFDGKRGELHGSGIKNV